MWVMDHIANNEISEAFGINYARIPLKDSAHILHGDALEADWSALLPPQQCSYILSSPPFLGAKFQTKIQREQVRRIAALGGSGPALDYAAAWRSEEHTSELQSLMRISYAVFCLKKKKERTYTQR